MQTLKIRLGDSFEILGDMEPESIWAVVCDPPYDLTPNKDEASGGFMGKQWDATGIAFSVEFWKRVYLVLKPGGMIKAFGGTRTFHKMARAIEESGFKDIELGAWMYSSGFPKSLNVSKQIDKSSGESPEQQAAWLKSRREELGLSREKLAEMVGCTNSSIRDWEEGRSRATGLPLEFMVPSDNYRNALVEILGYGEDKRTVIGESKKRAGDNSLHAIGHSGVLTSGGNTELSEKWKGWGTSLKPSWEPIVIARKPE